MSTVGGSSQQPQDMSIHDIANMFSPENMNWEQLSNPATSKLPDTLQRPNKPLPSLPQEGPAAPSKPLPQTPPSKPLPQEPADRASSTSTFSGVHRTFSQKETHVAGTFSLPGQGRVMDALMGLAKKVGTLLGKASTQVDKAKSFFANVLERRTEQSSAKSLDELAKPARPPAPGFSPTMPSITPKDQPSPSPKTAPPPPPTGAMPEKQDIPAAPPPPRPPRPDYVPEKQPMSATRPLPPPPGAQPQRSSSPPPSYPPPSPPKQKEEAEVMPGAMASSHEPDMPAPTMSRASVKPPIDTEAEAKPALGGAAYHIKHQELSKLIDSLNNNPSATLVLKDGKHAVSNRSTFALGARAGSSEATTKLFQELSHLEPSDLAHLLGELKNSDWLSAATKNLSVTGKQALAALETIALPVYIQQIDEASSNIMAFVRELKPFRDNPKMQADVAALKQKVIDLDESIQKAMAMIDNLSQKLDISDVQALPLLRAVQKFRMALSDYAPQFKDLYRTDSPTIRDISTPETNQNLIALKNSIPDFGIDLSVLEAKAKVQDFADYYAASEDVYQNMQALAAQLPEEVSNSVKFDLGRNAVGARVVENMAQFEDVAKYQAGVAKANTATTLPEFQTKLNEAQEPSEKQKLFTGAKFTGINKGVGEFSDNVITRMGGFLANDAIFGALLEKIPDAKAKEKILELRQQLMDEQREILSKQKAIKANNKDVEVSTMTVHSWNGPERHDLHGFQKRFNDLAALLQASIPVPET